MVVPTTERVQFLGIEADGDDLILSSAIAAGEPGEVISLILHLSRYDWILLLLNRNVEGTPMASYLGHRYGCGGSYNPGINIPSIPQRASTVHISGAICTTLNVSPVSEINPDHPAMPDLYGTGMRTASKGTMIEIPNRSLIPAIFEVSRYRVLHSDWTARVLICGRHTHPRRNEEQQRENGYDG